MKKADGKPVQQSQLVSWEPKQCPSNGADVSTVLGQSTTLINTAAVELAWIPIGQPGLMASLYFSYRVWSGHQDVGD